MYSDLYLAPKMRGNTTDSGHQLVTSWLLGYPAIVTVGVKIKTVFGSPVTALSDPYVG